MPLVRLSPSTASTRRKPSSTAGVSDGPAVSGKAGEAGESGDSGYCPLRRQRQRYQFHSFRLIHSAIATIILQKILEKCRHDPKANDGVDTRRERRRRRQKGQLTIISACLRPGR